MTNKPQRPPTKRDFELWLAALTAEWNNGGFTEPSVETKAQVFTDFTSGLSPRECAYKRGKRSHVH